MARVEKTTNIFKRRKREVSPRIALVPKAVDSYLGTADFLSGGGELGQLMRDFDWAKSPLGRPEIWPLSLQVTIRVMLRSGYPMFIWWGDELIPFYNDAYRKTMGPERHPSALGARGRECWAEIWPIIGPQIEYVMAGKGSTWDEDRLVPVTRNGELEDIWWTYSFSPIELTHCVGGVLVVCEDVSAQHRATSLLEDETRRLESLFEQAPGFMAIMRGPDHIFETTNKAYRNLVGNRNFVGKSVREAVPEAEGQGYLELLDKVYNSGVAELGHRMPLSVTLPAGAGVKDVLIDFIYQPIFSQDGKVTGIFVQGTDVTEHVRAEEHLVLMNLELKHRVKNMLAVVSSIAAQTLGAHLSGEVLEAYQRRLRVFAKAHDVLTQTSGATASVREIVIAALQPHAKVTERFIIAGPEIILNSQQAVSLSMALHELATNAIKHGALSARDGKIYIVWGLEKGGEQSCFFFKWEETDGPTVTAPTTKGFGSRLISNVLKADFGDNVVVRYAPTGLILELSTSTKIFVEQKFT